MIFFHQYCLVLYHLSYTVMATNPYSSLLILRYISNIIRREIIIFFLENHRCKFTIHISHFTTPVSILPQPDITFTVSHLVAIQLFIFPTTGKINKAIFLQIITTKQLGRSRNPQETIFIFFQIANPMVYQRNFISTLRTKSHKRIPVITTKPIQRSHPDKAFAILIYISN